MLISTLLNSYGMHQYLILQLTVQHQIFVPYNFYNFHNIQVIMIFIMNI